MSDIERRLYTIPEAALSLSVSTDTVRRLIKAGELQSVLLRGARRIRADSLDAYVDSLSARPMHWLTRRRVAS